MDMRCAYVKGVGDRLCAAPGLLFVVLSFVVNFAVYCPMTESPERDYVFEVWVSALICSFLWLSAIVLLPKVPRLDTYEAHHYLFVTACCCVSGFVLGPAGLQILSQNDLLPSERTAVVMLDMTVQWIQGTAELVNFAIHFYIFKSSKKAVSKGAVRPLASNAEEQKLTEEQGK